MTILVNKRNGGIRGEGLIAMVDSERSEDCIYVIIYDLLSSCAFSLFQEVFSRKIQI